MAKPVPTLDELKPGATAPAHELSPEGVSLNHFHGTPEPEWIVTAEQPWMRYAAYLFATGCMSQNEVATACDVHVRSVQNLLRQKWFQERVTQLMAANGGKDIMAMFKAEQFNTLNVLLDLRDGKATPSAVKFNVCRDILDRTLGKPVQRIETSATQGSDDPVAEAKRLEEELKRTR
jgi:hypothetical protein